MTGAQPAPAPPTRLAPIVVPLLVGAAVALSLGVYAGAHEATGKQTVTLFFTGTINFKVWFATLALVLALFQLATAARLFGKISWPATVPAWLGDAHRLSGTLAFAATLPVAYHCLWSLGFQTDDLRSVVHGVAGCVFYGAFATKVISVRSRRQASWTLPVIGGLTFAALVLVWLTSSLWFMTSANQPIF